MQIRLAPRRLVGRVVLLVIGIALVQFAVTILLYDRISRDSVREDHARRVAELLELPEGRVSVKATTTEKLGFTGRGEGIAAQAAATVRLPWTGL